MNRKRKKNPHNAGIFISLLKDTLLHGGAEYFVYTLIYYYQGPICNDCIQEYNYCECEYCDDCNFRRCMCKYSPDYRNSDLIRKDAWKFATEILDLDKLLKMIIDLYNLTRVFGRDSNWLKEFRSIYFAWENKNHLKTNDIAIKKLVNRISNI